MPPTPKPPATGPGPGPGPGTGGVSLATEAVSWLRFITGTRLGPYHPMPMVVVHQSLKLAKVGPTDSVIDLGCGDGRILITACRDYGARQGNGYELVPEIVSEARRQVENAKLQDKITIHQSDALCASLTSSTVLTCYLSNGGNRALAPALMHHLYHHPHARAVSFLFDFDNIMIPKETMLGDGGIPIHLYDRTSIPHITQQQIQIQAQTTQQAHAESAPLTSTSTSTPTSPSTSSSRARPRLFSSVLSRLRSPFSS